MIGVGDFVWTHFPLNENPRQPGLLHIAYCFAVYLGGPKHVTHQALVAYTTTAVPDQPYPITVRVFEAVEAKALGQSRFALDVGTLAILPIHQKWFPRFGIPGNGVVGTAPPYLQTELFTQLKRISERHPSLIERRGP